MGLDTISQDEARLLSVEALGFDGKSTSISSPEVLAAALRRGASFQCPTSATSLVDTVAGSLDWLAPVEGTLIPALSDMLDALIGCGDLLELSADVGKGIAKRALFLGSPAYVRRLSGSYLLLGIRPEGQPLVGEKGQGLVSYDRHLRAIQSREGVDVEVLLTDYGMREVSLNQWLSSPRPVTAAALIRDFDERLIAATNAGEINGMTILDSRKSVHYYAGRWRSPTPRDSGHFVARRPRPYGAPLWCYAEFLNGRPRKLIDLPLDVGINRGCDEAWRLQAAMDSLLGRPQRIRVTPSSIDPERTVIDLFSPPPGWFQRRLDALGVPDAPQHALLSYNFRNDEVKEELRFAAEMLWTLVDAT